MLPAQFKVILLLASTLSWALTLDNVDALSGAGENDVVLGKSIVGSIEDVGGFAPSPKNPSHNDERDLYLGTRDVESGSHPAVVFARMNNKSVKRQTCPPSSEGLCRFTGGDACCPSGYDRCCYGASQCLSRGQKCCDSGSVCGADQDCCGDRCMPSGRRCCTNDGRSCARSELCCETGCGPAGGECCRGGGYCEPGNGCYYFLSDPDNMRCCTNRRCTAYVENGSTISQSSTPPPAPPTSRPPAPPTSIVPVPTAGNPQPTSIPDPGPDDDSTMIYYYMVYKWYFWVHYYIIFETQSTVTYTLGTTVSIASIMTDNAAAASSVASSSLIELATRTPRYASPELATLAATPAPEITQTPELDVATTRPPESLTRTTTQISDSVSIAAGFPTNLVGGGEGDSPQATGGAGIRRAGMGSIAVALMAVLVVM